LATTSGPAGGSSSADRDATPAERVIARFGGIRPMANKLDIAVSTVQGWKERGHIPESRRAEIRDVAKALDIALDEDELRQATGATPAPESREESGPPDAARDSDRRPVFEGEAERIEDEAPAEAPSEAAGAEAPPEDARQPHVATEPDGRPGPARWPAVVAGAGAGAVLGAAAGAALWFLMPQLAPGVVVPDAASQERVARLEQQLADAQARLGETERQLQAARQGVEALEQAGSAEELRSTIEQMRSEMGALEERMAATAERLETTDIGQLADRVDALRQTVEALQTGLERAQARIEENAGPPEAIAGLQSSVQSLQEQLAALEQRVARSVNATATQDRERDRNAGLLVALTQLRTRVEAGAPYHAQLSALRSVLGPEPPAPWPAHLGPLAAHAGSGITNLADLRRRFPDMASAVLEASNLPADPDWLDHALAELQGVVTVRRVGPDVEGQDPGAVIARAEAALAEGDVAAAVDNVAALEGAAAEAAVPWLRDARTLRDALAALDALQTHLVAQLAERPSQ